MKIKQEGVGRKELQIENWNLRCMLWALAEQQGGQLRIKKAQVQLLNTKTSLLEFTTEVTTGDYLIVAKRERSK